MIAASTWHRFSFWLALSSWIVGLGGTAFAYLFGSSIAPPLAVMTSQAFFGAISVWSGWWLAIGAFGVSLVVALVTPRSRELRLALLMSGLYVAFGIAVVLHYGTYD